ncbi:ATP-binding protein [Streptomyces sp. NPDC090023]|uniref:ATP-binding protein n=1 Tax=unclassified Streptomyces TaxID=2593676 RepID=UPI0037FF6EDF
MACWQGDVDAASRVLDKLVDNAVKHARTEGAAPVPVRLYISESGILLVEVDDHEPQFADFASVRAGGPTTSGAPLGGLWWVQERYKAQLSYYVRIGDDGQLLGKTVQALMKPERGRAG